MEALDDAAPGGLSDLREVILKPAAPRPRAVGPGRLERGYRARIEALEGLRQAAAEREREQALRAERAAGELVVAARLERGLQRLLDRQEERLEVAAQREKRLALALGALQRDNELLRSRLELAAARPPARLAAARSAPRPGLWARLFGGARAR